MSDGTWDRGLSRRDFITAGAGAAGAIWLAACGGGSGSEAAKDGGGGKAATTGASAGGAKYSGKNVSLAFWNGFTGGDGPVMGDLVKRFNSEHPNIKVSMTTIVWADYYKRVPNAVKVGKGPDVGIMHIDQLPKAAAQKVIIPLDDVASALKLTESDFAAAVWKAGIYKDQRYGIPLDTHPAAFYYNKTLFAKGGVTTPPQDRASFEKAMEDMKKAGVQNPFWMPTLWPVWWMYQAMLWQNGGDLYNKDATEAAWNSPAGVEALDYMVSTITKGWSPKNVAQDANAIAFKNNKNAVIWDGIWNINDFNKTAGLEWDVAPMPVIFKQKAAWANSHNFTIMNPPNRSSDKVEAAKVFINWISEHSLDWAKGGQVPARNSIRNSAGFKALKAQAVFAEEVPYLHFSPAVPGIGDVTTETLNKAVTAVIQGQKKSKPALDQAAAQAKAMLKDNADKYGGA